MSEVITLTDQERWLVCSCLGASCLGENMGANMGVNETAISALRKLEGVDKVVIVETRRAGGPEKMSDFSEATENFRLACQAATRWKHFVGAAYRTRIDTAFAQIKKAYEAACAADDKEHDK